MEPASFNPFGNAGTASAEELRRQQVTIALLVGQGMHANQGVSILWSGLADLVLHRPSLSALIRCHENAGLADWSLDVVPAATC